MKRINSIIKKALCLLAAGAILVSAVGCKTSATVQPINNGAVSTAKTMNLMANFTSKNTAKPVVPANESAVKAADFAVRLFKAGAGEGNSLISPLSVLAALSMTANGAKGDTLAEMEKVLGMSTDELNEFYYNYAAQLLNSEKAKLELANSIWFTSDERFTVNDAFLQKNADYYGADAYKAPFDEKTRADINNWVKEKTDGMIPEILSKDVNMGDAVMFLINALAFDAEWDRIYKESEVGNAAFTLENGDTRSAEFMYGKENTYLKADNAEGFIKYYSGGRYAFCALLPNEGVSVSELVASLDGEKLMGILNGAKDEPVMTAIPKFETDFSCELSDVLGNMGMPSAFNSSVSDLSALGSSTEGNLYISRVFHKTFISVDERGTRAGAATAVMVCDEDAMLYEHTIRLDRPFVYMLIDTETNLPFFIGTMMDVGA